MKKSNIIAGFISFNSLFSNPTGNARLELFFDTKNVNNNETFVFNCIAQTNVWDENYEITFTDSVLGNSLELSGSTYNQNGYYYNGWDFISSQGSFNDGLTDNYGGVIGYGKYKIELESNTSHYIYVDYRNCQYPGNCDSGNSFGIDVVIFYEHVNNAYEYKWKNFGGTPTDTWHTLNFGDTIIIDKCTTPPTTTCFQPTNPSYLTYAVVNSNPRLSWTASYPPNATYNVYRDNVVIASNISGTTYTDYSLSIPGFNQFVYKVNANLSTADTPTSPGYTNSITVRRAQANAKTLTNLCNGNPPDSSFVVTDCDSIDLSVLQAFVDLNNVTPDSCNSCDYNSNGIVEPIELGQQEWVQGRLIELEVGQYRGGFNIQFIPNSINDLIYLKSIYLSFNSIESIPHTFWQLDSLNGLFIAGNDIEYISDSLGLLTNLEALGVYSNPIDSIPSSIGNLVNVKHLYLFDMELTTIPGSLWNLTNLIDLDLDRNQLTEIDNSIGNLQMLEELWLSDNNLTAIPDSIQYLTNLNELWIGNNYLYCVDGIQDTSQIPGWMFNGPILVSGIYEQNCSEMVINDEATIPKQFTLHQPYPNPFNPTTKIRFNVAARHASLLQVFDLTGRLVETLVNGNLQAGEHEIVWNAGSQPSGVYFVRLQSGEFVQNQKVIMLK